MRKETMQSKSAQRNNKGTVNRRSHRRKIAAIVVLMGGVVLGGGYLIQSRSSASKTTVMVPELSPVAQAERESFNNHCLACHGKNAAGTDNGPPLVNDI